MSSDYVELESNVNPDRFKKFVKHLGLASQRFKKSKTVQKRKSFVEAIGEFTESPDIKAMPDINEELRTLERKVGRSLDIEKALDNKEESLEVREKILEDKETALEMDIKAESEMIERLSRRVAFLEKKLNDSESKRVEDTQKLAKLSQALHHFREHAIKSFESKAMSFVEKKEHETRKDALKTKLTDLEKKHAKLVKAKKHDPKKLKLIEKKISDFKKLL